MAVYNGADEVEATLHSIQQQTFSDWQLIIVNDGSTDDTPHIINAYAERDDRIQILHNERNLKLAASLNRGIAAASADLIARHDCGDWSHPERLAQQVTWMQQHDDCILLGTQYRVVTSERQLLIVPTMPQTDNDIRTALQESNPFAHGSVMMRKSAWQAVGGYREDFPAAQDYELWLRLRDYGTFANLPDALYDWRFDLKATSTQHFAKQYAYARHARRLHGIASESTTLEHDMTHAPVFDNDINWLRIVAEAGHWALCEALSRRIWQQHANILQERDYLLAYMVKYGVQLAQKHDSLQPAEQLMRCFYGEDNPHRAQVMRRIYHRLPQYAPNWATIGKGLITDRRMWLPMALLARKRLAQR